MAKRKVRPHPGALAEELKRQNKTQMDAASESGIDRKTLAKINRGEEVKEETLHTLAKKLKVPATYFEPPASGHQEASQPDDPQTLSLTLRNLDAEGLAEMVHPFFGAQRIRWRLNVRTVDDETIQLLGELEDATNELHTLSALSDGTLRQELERLKKNRHVASLLEELAKRNIAIVGATYLFWTEVTHRRASLHRVRVPFDKLRPAFHRNASNTGATPGRVAGKGAPKVLSSRQSDHSERPCAARNVVRRG